MEPSARLKLNFPFEEPSTLGGMSGTGLLTLQIEEEKRMKT